MMAAMFVKQEVVEEVKAHHPLPKKAPAVPQEPQVFRGPRSQAQQR